MAGSYVLSENPRKRLFDPFLSLVRDRGTALMIAVAFLFSIVANVNKIVVLTSDVFFGVAIMSVLLGSIFTMMARVRGANIFAIPSARTIFCAGFLLACGNAAVNIALTLQIVPYVISVKRLSILFAVLLSGLLFKERIARRMLASSIMVLGAVIIALS